MTADRPTGPGEHAKRSGPDMECSDALERMYLFLDNEMDEASCDQVRRHLADCEPCLEQYDLEGMVKSLVHRACGCDKAPDQLRRKVMARITEIRFGTTASDA